MHAHFHGSSPLTLATSTEKCSAEFQWISKGKLASDSSVQPHRNRMEKRFHHTFSVLRTWSEQMISVLPSELSWLCLATEEREQREKHGKKHRAHTNISFHFSHSFKAHLSSVRKATSERQFNMHCLAFVVSCSRHKGTTNKHRHTRTHTLVIVSSPHKALCACMCSVHSEWLQWCLKRTYTYVNSIRGTLSISMPMCINMGKIGIKLNAYAYTKSGEY